MRKKDKDKQRSLSGLAAAVLAVGAGTAIALNHGGDELLSKELPMLKRALTKTNETFGKKSLAEMNGTGLSDLKRYGYLLRRNLEASEDIIDLDTSKTNSLLNIIKERNILSANKEKIAERNITNGLVRSLYKERVEAIEGIDFKDEDIAQRTAQLIDNIITRAQDSIKHIDPDTQLPEFSDDFKDVVFDTFGEKSGEVLETFGIMHKDTLSIIRDNKQEAMANIDKVIDKLDNYDELAGKFAKKEEGFFSNLMNELNNSQTATVNDIIEHADQIDDKVFTHLGEDPQTIIDSLKALREKDERFGDLVVDSALKIKDNTLQYYGDAEKVAKKTADYVSNETIGKIPKALGWFRGTGAEDPFYFISKGTVDYSLQAVAEGKYDGSLKNDYVRVLGKTYKVAKDQLEHLPEFDNAYMASDRSFEASQFREISGDVDRYVKSKEPKGFFGKLGLFTKPQPNAVDKKIHRRTKNNSISTYNKVMKDIAANEISMDEDNSSEYLSSAANFLIDSKNLLHEVDRDTKTVSSKTLSQVSRVLKNDKVTALYEATTSNERILEYVESLTGDDIKSIRNKDLASLVKKYKLSPSKALNSKSTRTEYGGVYNNSFLSYNKNTKTMDFYEQIQREITKEGLLIASNEKKSYEEVYNAIHHLKIDVQEKKDLKKFFHMSMFSDMAEVGLKYPGTKQANLVVDHFNSSKKLFAGANASSMLDDFNSTFKSISQKESSRKIISDEAERRLKLDTVSAARPNRSIHVKKGINIFDIIKDLNDTEKMKSGAKQYFAGRKNMQDVTAATMFPYYILNRLSKDLGKVGLNLSHRDNGSVVDVAKNIFLKRALPVYAGLTAFSYLDFETKNFTGTSLRGAAANSIANFQLGAKTFTDIFQGPLKDMHYWMTPLNYSQDHEYKTKAEYKKWLETGYEPVRKGKNWLLGQSEFIGGKINYYQPNFVKRANSDWYDEGVYGGSDEKWKHSIIPTPRHPLSTIRYLADPYWLERKHKYDRPYPVSGPMFDPQTPWGAIGNATIGNAIKPRKRLNREFMTKKGIDIRSIIADNNEYIKNKARSKYNSINIKSSDTFIETDSIGMDSVNHKSGFLGFNKYAPPEDMGYGSGGSGSGNGGGGGGYSSSGGYMTGSGKNNYEIEDPEISVADKAAILAAGGSYNRTAVLKEVEQINVGIKMRAKLSYGYDSNFAKEMQANNTTDVDDLLRTRQVRADLRNVSTTSEMLNDIKYSVKELSGIYSFMNDMIFKPQRSYALSNSSEMYANTRKFWESGNEGYDKGGVMEIVRRFIPHEDRSRIRINPLKNNMPNWLPSRFRYGDPYSLVKKGEMRLPGKGYEDINKDQQVASKTIGPSVISGSKDEILEYLINGSNTTNKKLNDIMEEGNELHEKYEKYLLDSGMALSIEGEINDDENNIKGFYDVKLKDASAKEGVAVMDIKTVGSSKFNQVASEGVNAKHKAQVNYYLGLMNLSKGYVHYIDRDDETRMITYDFEFDQSLYNQTLKNLQDARKELTKMVKNHKVSPYENYSDFQKFKILADVAPGSDEYKKYRQIVQGNLREDQREEFSEILERVEEQSKNHKFSNYKFIGFKAGWTEGVVQSVSNKGIKLINDEKTYKLAGIEDLENKVASYIRPGMEIKLEFDRLDKERKTINAIAFEKGDNINRKMIKSNDAKRKEDGSAIARRAGVTSTQVLLGKPFELISHLPIPYVHNKFLKVDTPYESWLNENIYGSKYQTWERPIKTMLLPSLRKDMGSSYKRAFAGTAMLLANEIIKKKDVSDLTKWGVDKVFKMVTPGAFTGAIAQGVLKLNWADSQIKNGARIGAVIGLGGFLLNNAQNPLLSVSSGAALGFTAANWLVEGLGTKGAAIGAGVGLLMTGMKTDFNFKKMTSKWIPKNTKKRWEIEEYFDRLKFVKYQGLYEKAADLAQRKEGINIRGIINKYEKREKNFDKDIENTIKLKHIFNSGTLKDTEAGNYYGKVIDDKLNTLIYGDENLAASKYVRSALAYKQAMESTVYALNKNSSYTQILRSLEKYERDYFLEFMKETDPKEQNRILKTIAPNKRKILQMAWGKNVDKDDSNIEYFRSHKLPSIVWRGWSNNTDLEEIKMKTIANEGMELSDFGYYDSSKDTPQYHKARALNYDKGTDPITVRANLLTALSGLGLRKSEVTIEPSEQEGLQVAINLTRVGSHKIKTLASNVLSNFY